MSKLVFNRDGGKTDEFGHLIALMRFMQGEVIEGLQVAANGAPNMSVNVPYGIAAIPTGSGATGYRYFVGLDATENVAIPTANGSNPRNDLIVLWVDKSVTPSQSFTNNSNNMLKISVVSGAPATTPADPSTAAIQAAIGAANPYIILARVVTGAGVTQINNGNITDLRNLTSVSRLLTNQIVTAYVNDLAITSAKLADSAVTTAKVNNLAITKGKIDFGTFVTRNDFGTISTGTQERIERGWARISGVSIANGSVTVTFSTPFVNAPQVVASFAGHTAATNAPYPATATDGYTDNIMVNPFSVTNTGFKIGFARGSGATFNSIHTLFANWVAIGN